SSCAEIAAAATAVRLVPTDRKPHGGRGSPQRASPLAEELVDRLDDRLELRLLDAGEDRERQRLARERLGHRARALGSAEAREGGHQVDRLRVMAARADMSFVQEALKRV